MRGARLRMIDMDGEEMAEIEKEMRARAAAAAARLVNAPGTGPAGAVAFRTFAPQREGFRRGRDFAVWPGPVPRQHGTRGETRLGRVSQMGRRDRDPKPFEWPETADDILASVKRFRHRVDRTLCGEL